MADKDSMTIDLPWPPSANKYWRIVNNRVVTSRAGRRYQRDVADLVWRQTSLDRMRPCGTRKITRLVITAYPPDRRRRDIDNIIKPTVDALKLAGMFDDDSQIQAITAQWATREDGTLICVAGGMLKVSIHGGD